MFKKKDRSFLKKKKKVWFLHNLGKSLVSYRRVIKEKLKMNFKH